jgi:hypothetical protein
VARAEAGEAAAALEGAQRLGLVREAAAEPVLGLLWRLYAMLTRCGRSWAPSRRMSSANPSPRADLDAAAANAAPMTS